MALRDKFSERKPSTRGAESAGPSTAHVARGHGALLALVLSVGSLSIVYGGALRAPFLFDDQDAVLRNPSIQRLWPLVGTDATPGPLNPRREISTSGRPLVNVSLAVNYRFGQLDPIGYHVFNLVLHALSTLLLWGIIRRTLRLEHFHGQFESVADPLALCVAIVWALHPLQTEAVEYVTQRTELMMGLFHLATLYASLRYWAARLPGYRTAWGIAAGSACLLGMGCKEVMVTAPVVVLLFERTFVAGSFRQAARASWPLYVALVSGWGLLLVLNFNGPRAGSAGFHAGVPVWAWWLTQAKVVWMYLKLSLWPWPLTIHYDIPYLTTLGSAWPWVVPLVVLAVLSVALLWRRSAVGFAAVCPFLMLTPTLIVPIATEVAAERRMYLPLAPLVALAIVGGYHVLRCAARRAAPDVGDVPAVRWPLAAIVGISGAMAVAFSFVSINRLAAYNDGVALWQDAATRQPNDSVAHVNLGVALAARKRLQEAIVHYEQALRLKPDSIDARSNMAEAYYDLGLGHIDQGRPVEALPFLERALAIDPKFVNAHYALAGALASQGDLREAAIHYRAAADLRPGYSAAGVSLGWALAKLGDSSEAARAFSQVIDKEPDNPDARFGLAVALSRQGKRDEASAEFKKSLALYPNQAEAHFEWANVLVGQNDFHEAERHYLAAVRARPTYADALINLGALYLAKGDGAKAVPYLKEALRLQPDNQQARANLERASAMPPGR